MADQATVDAFVSAQRDWLSREPMPEQFPITPQHLATKREQWRRWRADGETMGLLPGYCPDGFATWVAKFNPAESRGFGGEWTAGGSQVHTTTTPGRGQLANAQAQRRRDAAAARTADQKAYADAQARIAGRGKPATPKGAQAAAVAAARKQYSIPTGKKFKALPPAKRAAATNILTAVRQLSSLSTQNAGLTAHTKAIQKEIDAAPSAGVKAKLRAQLDRVTARQSAVAAATTAAQGRFNAARKAWRGK